MAREDRGWGVVDEDGRWLVLRTLKPSWFHDVDFSPLEATPDPWPEGMSVAPSFERRGERHTIELQDGTVFDGGVTGAAPTDMTQKEAELWAKHVGGVAKQLPMEKA